MQNRKKKTIVLIALICVLSVSIGFAAFSSSLLIRTHLSVDPSADTFSVVFSTNSTTLNEGNVTPTTVPNTLSAQEAVIDNSTAFPTISNLHAEFTEPGQSVTYTFYALNTGEYDAYLNSIVLQNLAGGSFKECIAKEGASLESVNSACNSIIATVKVGDISTTSTMTTTGHYIMPDKSDTVTITFEYAANGARADGPFTVNFGNVYFTYSTQDGQLTPSVPETVQCIMSNDVNSDGEPSIGDEVTCGTEIFYVVPNDTVDHASLINTDTISLMAKYGLNSNTSLAEHAYKHHPKGIQSSFCTGYNGGSWYCGSRFSSNYYWNNNEKYLSKTLVVNGETKTKFEAFPFVYDSNSAIYLPLEEYKTTLNDMGIRATGISMPAVGQLEELGCQIIGKVDYATVGNSTTNCTNAPSWLKNISFMIANAYNGNHIYYYNSVTNMVTSYRYTVDHLAVIRPVVMIDKEQIRTTSTGTLAPGLYDAYNNLVTSWDELVTTYGLDATSLSNGTEVFNNSNLSSGTKLVIGKNVESIADNAFNSANLTSVTIPSNVTSIGNSAFANSMSLVSLTLHDGIKTIGQDAFTSTNIANVTIPSSVTSIGDRAFANCNKLAELTLQEGLVTIGQEAFKYTNIGRIIIPSTVTSIGDGALANCDKLSNIYYKGTATGAPWGATGVTVTSNY